MMALTGKITMMAMCNTPKIAVSLHGKVKCGTIFRPLSSSLSLIHHVLSYDPHHHPTKTANSLACCHTSTLTPMASFYRRKLPSPAISLYSEDGKRLLEQATAAGTAAGFLEIATNLLTQRELTYCGLTSLTTILNALFIDPQHVWKGPWRWYDETMLVDGEKLDKANVGGLSFQDRIDVVPTDKVKLKAVFASDSSLMDFKEHVLKACSSDSSYVLASYSSGGLGQTGAGHFSPIAAYNSDSDAVLLLDVARFKYPPHWIPCHCLWKAMSEVNMITKRSRGFMLISKP